MIKITACLVVHNEAAQIRECLVNLEGVVDEIIVVHDGECSDATIEICQSFGIRAITRPFAGFMEAHLPFCFRLAQGQWILRLDADERLSRELKNQIRTLVADELIAGYEFLWPFYDGKKTITEKWPHKRCLFKKNSISFLGSLHEPVAVRGVVLKSNLILEHRPNYDNFSWFSFRNKWRRWAEIQAGLLHEDFQNIEKFNYTADRWPLKYRIRKNYHLLLALPDFFLTFFKTLIADRGFREGRIAFKYALFSGLYKIMLDYYLLINKIKKT